jgi:hypothetical protein
MGEPTRWSWPYLTIRDGAHQQRLQGQNNLHRNNIIKDQCIFMDVMKPNKPDLRVREWFFHCGTALLHSAKAVKGFLVQKSI